MEKNLNVPYRKISGLCKTISILIVFALLLGTFFSMDVSDVSAADLFQANFDSGTNGFSYLDDVFGTDQPSYASGSRVTGANCYGGSGGCLNVRLGGINSTTVNNMSGGWRYTFNLATAQSGVSLSLRYRLVMPAVYDYDEYSRVQVSIDGTLYGRGAKQYVDHVGGDNTFAHDAGWLQVELYIGELAAGAHNLIIGGFSNKKNATAEITDIYIDTVALTNGSPAPVPSTAQVLVDRLDLGLFKDSIWQVANFGDRCRMTSGNGTNCVAPYTSYFNAQNWLATQLAAMGYTVEYNTYTTTLPNTTGSNLYVTKVGTTHPESMYIVSNMLDGRGGGGAADDDASGVALTLELARVLASPDVQTDYSVRFIFFDEEERGLYGSQGYVSTRQGLRGIENPAGSGVYPEPNWLGIIQHDMILYDHGVGTNTTTQSPYADLDVEWTAGATFANQSMALAQKWRFLNGEYAVNYPANSADKSQSTDDYSFRNHCPAVSVRENRRSVSGEWINPHYHKTTDVYASYSEADFLLGFNAAQTTLGVVAELAGASFTTTNQPPSAAPQALTTDEDTQLAITLGGSDPENSPLSFTILTDPLHGTLSGDAPALTYTPISNFNGADSFTFKVNDGSLDSTPATISITVNPVNDLPVAHAQYLETQVDIPLAITLAGSDVETTTLIFNITSQPTHGSLSGTAPQLTYTPAGGFIGSDSFTFTVNDGTATSAPAAVAISIGGQTFQLPFTDDFETDKGWTVNPFGTDTSYSGQWERANPQATFSQGPKQLDITTSEANNLVTGSPAGTNAGKYDVDKRTSILSPSIQLPTGQNILLSFNYYFAHANNAKIEDYFMVQVIGDTTLTVLEIRGSGVNVDAAWQNAQFSLDSFAGQTVRIKFEAQDDGRDSLVEAAVDDLSITATNPKPPLLSANFDAGVDGFGYLDDAFRETSQPGYASGAYQPGNCLSGGCLQVFMGGLDTEVIKGISAGWTKSFTLAATSDVVISFWYKLTQSSEYDLDEFSQVLVSLDGTLYGAGMHDYAAQVNGNGNGGIPETTGWQFFAFSVENLPAGSHSLTIGGYNNQKSYTNEFTDILIDQVLVQMK